MPKAINYKANSVVYFSGDFDERVFLLNTGSIALTSIDIETGEQVTDYIKTGEFFGVKSALGNYPREESAMVLTDSIVYSFTSREFEAFAQTNTRIILQMIKVFSRQLRSIHKQLASLLDSEEETNPEEGLFNVMNAFYSSQHYGAAGHVGARYKAIYPNGKYISQVDQIVRSTAEVAGRSFGNAEGHNEAAFVQPEKPAQAADGTIHLTYNKAEDLFEKGEFEAAYDQYHAVIEAGAGDEITDNAYIGAGKTLHAQKEYVRCLQLLTGFISQHPKSLKIGDALMYLGMCYMDMERPDKAIAFFDKAAILSGPGIIGKIRELQKECSTMLQGA
ncbi:MULTISPECIES: cyclic nucleotide-binding domain-containing protein [unclassified Treponema]|uniref:cyclic nucleotide-binding domain-containing protein n=1 Tax=unclassified Treponema TaxID=2638727 RepID=UPI0020A42A12|nr:MULTISPECIES: cyclic nucleotide-binding domain-containing protein [unclassified Treponema]UTC66386.1 cyclic nucleotide-binding domain-containing protein [Treponema sp. OMZ 789]UTC69116.1 cyclic nucleotide-binding domain-containing protein [Treponema sp. OMZ 790]UTC71828.1 cyclic nucleotide-binding domain-containing protein [Treponema sp. OMZ 791]